MLPEFNPTEALLISLPHERTDWAPYLDEILASYERFIFTSAEHTKVILVHAPGADVSKYAGCHNIELFEYLTNDTWIRDYAPISTKDGFLGFCFNAWGGKFASSLDDGFKDAFAKRIAPIQRSKLICEGGALETNGCVLLATAECLLNDNRNGFKSALQAEQAFCEALNLERLWLLNHGHIIGDDTDSHIDTLARFLSPNIIAHSACFDRHDEHYDELSKMSAELRAFGCDLVPLPLPAKQTFNGKRLGFTYANFVIVNDAIIMPTYADAQADSYAAAALAEASGKDVRCVPASVFVRQNGSLHCSCMNILKGTL